MDKVSDDTSDQIELAANLIDQNHQRACENVRFC